LLFALRVNDQPRPHDPAARSSVPFRWLRHWVRDFHRAGLILRQVHGSVALSLLVWIVGGGLSLLGALTYAELAAANPEAGGLYCYIRDGFGALPAFLYGWCLFVVIASGTIAALARAFTKYLNEIVQLGEWQSNAISIGMILLSLLSTSGAHARAPICRTSRQRSKPGWWFYSAWRCFLRVIMAASLAGD